jgi:hypothetical protein
LTNKNITTHHNTALNDKIIDKIEIASNSFDQMNQISLEGAEDQYDEVLSRLQEEEEKVNADLQKNALVLPNIIKKGTINLQVDKRILKSFKDDRDTNNFSFYLSQRRQSSQSIESAMTQCSQFATYCKSKYSELKDIYTPMQLFHDISTK